MLFQSRASTRLLSADQTGNNPGYHNLRILLFGSLVLGSSAAERATIPGSHEATQKYLDSACKTIEIIYHTYMHNDFFQTW